MSYDICYDRKFIRSGLGITPMWLVGSNNCTEPHWVHGRLYQRRERYWSPLFNMVGVDPDTLIQKAQTYCRYNDPEHFVFRGKWLHNREWMAWVSTGIKNAVTIEELLEAAGYSAFTAKLSVWKMNAEKGWHDQMPDEQKARIRTTKELDDWIEAARQRVENRDEGEDVYYCIDFNSNEPIPLRATLKHQEYPVVAKFGKNYVLRVDEHGYSYGPMPENALVFASWQAAYDLMVSHYHLHDLFHKLTFVKADTLAAKNAWKWVIRIASGSNNGYYIREQTSRKLRLTSAAKEGKRFASEAAANRYIAKLREKYSCEFKVEVIA